MNSLGNVNSAVKSARKERKSISKNSRPFVLAAPTSVSLRPTCHQKRPGAGARGRREEGGVYLDNDRV